MFVRNIRNEDAKEASMLRLESDVVVVVAIVERMEIIIRDTKEEMTGRIHRENSERHDRKQWL